MTEHGSPTQVLHARFLLLIALLGVGRLIVGQAITQRSVRVPLDFVMDVVLLVLLVRAFRRRPKPLALRPSDSGLDARHAGVVAVMASAFASGLNAAGAPLSVVLAVGLVGACVGFAVGKSALPPWQDPNHGPWVGGAIFGVVAAVAVLVSILMRPDN